MQHKKQNYRLFLTSNLTIQSLHIYHLLLAFWLFTSPRLNAQHRKWRNRIPNSFGISLQAGPSFFLSDLGGSSGNNRDGLADLNAQSIRYMVGTGLQFRPTKTLGGRVDVNYAMLHADDAFSGGLDRRQRNLSVSTNIVELNSLIALQFFSKKRNSNKWYAHLSLGTSLVYFNPKTTLSGKRHHLRDYGTEGQILNGQHTSYPSFTLAIPLNLGLYKRFSNGQSIGFELQTRKTFTDYLDDVSSHYADNKEIATNQNQTAAKLADRNLSGSVKTAGSKRGNPSKMDHYFFVVFSYKIILGNKAMF